MRGGENFGGAGHSSAFHEMCCDHQFERQSYPHLIQLRGCAEDEEDEETLPGIVECDDEPQRIVYHAVLTALCMEG